MIRSRRLKYAAATAPLQFSLSVVLALVLAQLASDSSGEWADLIGVVLGIVLGPCLGFAMMVFLVQRARDTSAMKALLAGTSGAVGSFAVTVALFGASIHPFAAIVIVFALSTAVVWVLSGRAGQNTTTE